MRMLRNEGLGDGKEPWASFIILLSIFAEHGSVRREQFEEKVKPVVLQEVLLAINLMRILMMFVDNLF